MYRLLCLVVPALLFASAGARAGFHAGVAMADEIDGVASHALTLSWETPTRHPWEFMLGYIAARNAAAARTPDVYFGSVSKRFIWRGWFVQGGIVATNSETEALSKHWQFQTGIGYRYQRLTFSLRHLSNANTGGRNRGENLLLVQYGF